MNNIKIKRIIRICRTWPTEDFRSIGLHAYNYTKYINIPTEIFLKNSYQKNDLQNLKNANFKMIKYYDLKFTLKNPNPFSYFIIAFSKLIGEFLMFLKLTLSLDRKNIKSSIIHIHCANYMISGIIISRVFNIPVILQLGGTDIFRIKNSVIHRNLIKLIDYFICVNKNIANEIKEIDPNAQVSIVGNSADIETFKPGEKDPNIFTSIGNLRWQKNYSTMIRAFKIFLKKNPNAILQIFGDGPDKNNLLKLIKDLKLKNKVILKGYCDYEVISKELSKTYIYLQSSISEGLPKALLEALSSGCPVVTTDAGGCKEISKEFGFCVRKDDPNEFAKAMIDLYEKKSYWKKCYKKCLKYRNSLGWETLVKKVLCVYNKIYN